MQYETELPQAIDECQEYLDQLEQIKYEKVRSADEIAAEKAVGESHKRALPPQDLQDIDSEDEFSLASIMEAARAFDHFFL